MRTARLALALVLSLAPAARAWDAHGHRLITELALSSLPPTMPGWLRDPAVIAEIAEQSLEPDKWRASRSAYLAHENAPDHYLDVEMLADSGLTLRTMPRLRYDYVLAIGAAHARGPGAHQPPKYPGFAVHAVMEHYAKLQSSFAAVRILERLADPARAAQLARARANAIYHMGVLSHFVGDLAQPLHVTIHHHGWVGDNPKHYTTDRGFHAHIDGEVLRIHAITLASLAPRTPTPVRAEDPWDDTIALVERSFALVEPLYILERTRALADADGKAFILERLSDGGATLAGLYLAAWESAQPDERSIAAFARMNPPAAP